MDEAFGRRGLVDPAALRAFNARSDWKGGTKLAAHAGLALLTGTALALTWGSWWAVPVFLAHGVVLNFLYAAQHELSHYTVFKTRRLNEIFGRAIGFLMLYPRDFDQIQHFAHHRHTQDWDKDGELAGRPPYTRRGYVLWLTGISYWYSRVARILRLARGVVVEPYVQGTHRRTVIREARWHLAGYALVAVAAIAAGSWAPVILWLAPMMAMKWVHQLQNTIEHFGLTHAPDTWANTRTARTIAPLRWLGWNMQYHTAHHSFPSVPFHALPRLHAAIVARTGAEPQTMGYLEFQRAVFARLTSGRGERDYPDGESWIFAEGQAPAAAAPADAGSGGEAVAR